MDFCFLLPPLILYIGVTNRPGSRRVLNGKPHRRQSVQRLLQSSAYHRLQRILRIFPSPARLNSPPNVEFHVWGMPMQPLPLSP